MTPTVRALCLLWLAFGCGVGKQVELPAPTGALAIGRRTLNWSDEARLETMTDDPADLREVTVHLWYPAAPESEGLAGEYIPRLESLKDALDRRTVKAFERVHTHAKVDVPAAETSTPFPLIVLTHGTDMQSSQYSALAEELVSHGFVVVAVDHPYQARAALLLDGRAVPMAADRWPALPPPSPTGEPDDSSQFAQFYRSLVEVRMGDIDFVLAKLRDSDETGLKDRLDFDRLGVIGHSVGGVTAAQLCHVDARFRGCVNLDGDYGNGPFFLEQQVRSAAAWMMITKSFVVSDEQLSAWGKTRESWLAMLAAHRERYFSLARGGSYRVVLDGAEHESFSDDPYVFASLEEADVAQPLQLLNLTRSFSVDFLRKTLLDLPSTLLDAESAPAGSTLERWPAHAH